jgi:hypothetical protein
MNGVNKNPIPVFPFLRQGVYALCSGTCRELSITAVICNAIDLEQEKLLNLVVPGNLTRVKQRGAAARYRIVTSKALRRLLICSLLKSERRFEDGVLERAQPESLNLGRFGANK